MTFPALRKSVEAKDRPIRRRSSALCGTWNATGRRSPCASGRGQDHVLPRRVAVTVVPGNIVIHHGAGRRMRRHVLDPPFANDPDFTPVTQAVAILSTSTNHCPPCRRCVLGQKFFSLPLDGAGPGGGARQQGCQCQPPPPIPTFPHAGEECKSLCPGTSTASHNASSGARRQQYTSRGLYPIRIVIVQTSRQRSPGSHRLAKRV